MLEILIAGNVDDLDSLVCIMDIEVSSSPMLYKSVALGANFLGKAI